MSEKAASEATTKSYDYLEPPAALGEITNASLKEQRAVLSDSTGLTLEIQFLQNFGWSLELRCDLLDTSIRRQPITAQQDSLERGKLGLNSSESTVSLSCGVHRLEVARTDGALKVFNAEQIVFSTEAHPFRRHQHAIEIYENIVSRKVTDHSFRSPTLFTRPTTNTRMVRFQYPRPKGLVLGLPGQAGEMNRNGYRFELYNTDMFSHTPNRPPMYQSWPILIHHGVTKSSWVGVFHDNPSRTYVDLGEFYPDQITFESITNNSRVYIASASSVQELTHQFINLLGAIQLPPQWTLGYQQCRWSYMSTQEARKVVSHMHKENFPCDVVYFDIDYMDRVRPFTLNQQSYGDLAECVKALKKHDVHTVCIVDPGVPIDPEYPLYNQLSEEKLTLKNSTDEELEILCWPGKTALPDFGDDRVREIWSDNQSQWLKSLALGGVWNDMNEPANFDGQNSKTSHAMTARGAFRDQFNLYGYHMAQASAEGWRKARGNERGLIISRAGYPGIQAHAVIWHGDNAAWWEHLRLALDTAVQYSMLGAFFTGPDLPGHSGFTPDDLAVRFFQLGAFLPFCRGHTRYFEHDKEPYAFGKEAQSLIRDALNLRYSLLREWYSGLERAIREHRSPLMPVLGEDGELIRDQFLLFDDLLVAPVMQRDVTKRLVYLPAGEWYRLGNCVNRIPGASWIVEPVTLASIPIYVRAGRILVRNQPQLTVPATFAVPERYEIYFAADNTAEGYRFEDDGKTTGDPNAKHQRLVAKGNRIDIVDL